MNKLALLAAILFTLISGRPAEATSFVTDWDFTYTTISGTTLASGEFLMAPPVGNSHLMSVSGSIDGYSITGFDSTSVFQQVPGGGFYTLVFDTSRGSSTFSGGFGGAGTGGLAQAYSTINGTNIDFPSGTFTLSIVPLPASAPLFGLALLAFAAIGFGSKRLKREPCSPAIIVG
jgi:hypothetical protein